MQTKIKIETYQLEDNSIGFEVVLGSETLCMDLKDMMQVTAAFQHQFLIGNLEWQKRNLEAYEEVCAKQGQRHWNEHNSSRLADEYEATILTLKQEIKKARKELLNFENKAKV